jgi:hypothetical protein
MLDVSTSYLYQDLIKLVVELYTGGGSRNRKLARRINEILRRYED